MKDSIDRLMDFGFGLFNFSKEKIEEFVQDMVDRGEVTREEASRVVSEMTEKGKEQRSKIQEYIDNEVKKNLHYFVTKDEVREIIREELRNESPQETPEE